MRVANKHVLLTILNPIVNAPLIHSGRVANWSHENERTPSGHSSRITALCSRLKMETPQSINRSVIIDLDGGMLLESIIGQVTSDSWDTSRETAQLSKQHYHAKSLSPASGLEGFLAHKVEARIYASEPGRLKQVVLDLIESWGPYTGKDVGDQSLKYHFLEAWNEIAEFFLDTSR